MTTYLTTPADGPAPRPQPIVYRPATVKQRQAVVRRARELNLTVAEYLTSLIERDLTASRHRTLDVQP